MNCCEALRRTDPRKGERPSAETVGHLVSTWRPRFCRSSGSRQANLGAWGRLAGIKAETLRDQLGHSSVLMTVDVYSHAQDRAGEAALLERFACPEVVM